MAWKSSTYDPNSKLGKIWHSKWEASSPEQRAHLVDVGAFTPEGVAHQHIASGYLDGLKDIPKALGQTLKIAAPVAGLAIPGLSPWAAAALAAGGSAAGGALHGDRFDLGKTLEAGAAGYGGASARGALTGQAAIGTAAGQGALGGAANTVAFANAAPLATAAAGSGGLGSLVSQAGKYAMQHPGDIARVGLGALGAIQGSQQQGKADELIKRSLAPLNQANPYADLNVGSYGNPFAQPAQMSGRASLRRELMR